MSIGTVIKTFIGSIFSFPYILTFYSTWVIASIYRPFKYGCLVLMLIHYKATLHKIQLITNTFLFMFLCKDKKWKLPAPPEQTIQEQVQKHLEYVKEQEKLQNDQNNSVVDSTTKNGSSSGSIITNGDPGTNVISIESRCKTVVFIRHGESTWNDTFNKGSDRSTGKFLLWFIPNVIRSFAIELYFIVVGRENESYFYDSPLSPHGIQQSETVRKYLTQQNQSIQMSKLASPTTPLKKEDWYIQLMLGTNTTKPHERAPLISSNLRRAISTMAIVLQDRLNNLSNNSDTMDQPMAIDEGKTPKTKTSSSKKSFTTTATNIMRDEDKIIMLTCLQEISINPDALAITPNTAQYLKPTFTDPECIRDKLSLWVNTMYNDGNKLMNTNGKYRLEEFVNILFNEKKGKLPDYVTDANEVIVAGHSLWFKSFFQMFLPASCNHICKKKKVVNCGCVGFKLYQFKIVTQQQGGAGATKSISNKKITTLYQIDPTTLQVFYGGFK